MHTRGSKDDNSVELATGMGRMFAFPIAIATLVVSISFVQAGWKIPGGIATVVGLYFSARALSVSCVVARHSIRVRGLFSTKVIVGSSIDEIDAAYPNQLLGWLLPIRKVVRIKVGERSRKLWMTMLARASGGNHYESVRLFNIWSKFAAENDTRFNLKDDTAF